MDEGFYEISELITLDSRRVESGSFFFPKYLWLNDGMKIVGIMKLLASLRHRDDILWTNERCDCY